MNLEPWSTSVRDFADWLALQNSTTAKGWGRRLNADNDATVEGAVAEAVAWDFLYNRVDRITLHEDPSAGGPDFLCEKNGLFLVEVTNIATSTTAQRTGLHPAQEGFGYYATLTNQLVNEVQTKAAKAAGLVHPLVLLATTLHFDASALCVNKHHLEELLLGSGGVGSSIDLTTGDSRGGLYEYVSFDRTAFSRCDSLDDARRNISALLVGGFGLRPPAANVAGVLHPNPVRPFDPNMLGDIPFGRRRVNLDRGTAWVEWTTDSD